MAGVRTQVYLTVAQRRGLDELGRLQGRRMAELVREAVDSYLALAGDDTTAVLTSTFGALPDIEVPGRDEWEER